MIAMRPTSPISNGPAASLPPALFAFSMVSSTFSTRTWLSQCHWLSHVRVANVDETIEKAKRAGGKLAAGPFEMGEVGRIAIIADPQGAYISAYQPESEGPASEGVFVWDELVTTDADGAQRFYSEVFGWTTSDMGPDFGGYRIFNRGETGIAGLMTLPDATVPPHWQPYVAVADPDATSAKAEDLGGSTLMEPMDV